MVLEEVGMILWECLVWAVVEGLFDLRREMVASEIVRGGVGELGLRSQVSVSLGPQS